MTILCQSKAAVRIRAFRNIANQTVRPLFCQAVMQPERDASPHAITTRTLRSSFKDTSYFARGRPSVMEPLWIDQATGDECDPRNHGYRVVSPHKNRGYTTATNNTNKGTTLPFEQPPVRGDDEYSFIMSSPHPVSAEQCAKHSSPKEQCDIADPLAQVMSTETLLDGSLFYTEYAESKTEWANQRDAEEANPDDIDMSLE